MPIWIMTVIAGIIFCAFMTLWSMRNETKAKNHTVEDEGKIFIDRMEGGKKSSFYVAKLN